YAGVEYPERFNAVVDFYGMHPNVQIDPARVRVPVLGHFGTHDKSFPEPQVRAFAHAIASAGGSFTVHFYDAGHAFFNDARPAVYSEENAKLAWDRTLTFLKEHVR